ncbi:GMC oxidoreductase [Spongisporangium articulatum]|uniref:Cholesterol oxidase n=1 Tax=Spongisporangium articulatum TaxID=3362603 RepID=A0ABW8AMS4_9ACTN
MPTIDRRTLLTGAAASLGLGLAGSRPAAAAPVAARVNAVPVRREQHRVVVVGSGFGGGVTALRLAQAGVPVTLLEQGIRWPTGPNSDTFPHVTAPDKRLLWFGANPRIIGQKRVFAPYPGLVDAVHGDNITSLYGVGVGGGSLIYQGMTLQPAEHVFRALLPDGLNWDLMNRVYYPRVARMLHAATAPDALINSRTYRPPRIFKRYAERAGYSVEKIPMPIDWNVALAELRGELRPSYINSDLFGARNGGKFSVDVTYVKQAEATGNCTVHVLHQVTDVARAKDGRWEVHVDRLNMTGDVVEKKILTTRALVLGAGSGNTSKLLVRAAGTGQITDLPEALGTGWGTNGDRIYVWTNLEDDFGTPQGGPVIYGTKDWADPARANTVIQASLPFPAGVNPRSTMMVGFGVSTGRGRFVYDGASDKVKLHWPKNGDAAIWKTIAARANRIVGRCGFLTDTNALANTTWHPLGGAAMGSVCDLDGRVLGQKGLYVLDGALIPGTTGACNPSMTIAAVAERALDNLVRADVGSLI